MDSASRSEISLRSEIMRLSAYYKSTIALIHWAWNPPFRGRPAPMSAFPTEAPHPILVRTNTSMPAPKVLTRHQALVEPSSKLMMHPAPLGRNAAGLPRSAAATFLRKYGDVLLAPWRETQILIQLRSANGRGNPLSGVCR